MRGAWAASAAATISAIIRLRWALMASPRRHAVKVEDSMRLGYFAMPLHPPGADPATTMDGDLAQLATLDRLGYEEPASPTAGRGASRAPSTSPTPTRARG